MKVKVTGVRVKVTRAKVKVMQVKSENKIPVFIVNFASVARHRDLYLCSQPLRKLRQEFHLSLGLRGQPRSHGEILSSNLLFRSL